LFCDFQSFTNKELIANILIKKQFKVVKKLF